MKYVSLNGLSKIADRDPRALAADLLRLGIQPDAILEQEKRNQPLFECDRVELIAKALMESARKNAQTTKQIEDKKK